MVGITAVSNSAVSLSDFSDDDGILWWHYSQKARNV